MVAAIAASGFIALGQGTAAAVAECAYRPPDRTAQMTKSAIDARYSADSQLRALLGAPAGDEVGEGIRYRDYQRGRMYWASDTGARESHGAILEKYLSKGGHEAYGAPVTDECPSANSGRYNHFSGTSASGGTSIYWRADLGVKLVSGQVHWLWEHSDWERGTYGQPITDTLPTRDLNGEYNDFLGNDGAGASIYWTRFTGVHGVKGAIRDRWLAMDAEKSFLGYPTSDELDTTSGKRSNFQGGYVTWNRATGEVVARLWYRTRSTPAGVRTVDRCAARSRI
ncbi:LGFP repeat-containing protein [Herbihabitans rhizosphaerae]|uniref:LGFP repeat-containing protein n=1 Tax=Herbihabitans rhizosphaerae TaxID=1872711 RepID=A0A4Q7KJF5_9PSEU|nr:hypothetical protein [Herbihabitans rhizosphaerae]RZS34006.1 LGFP repeat-containing protein [Herbihabitans rhizosphaerae]